MINVTENRRDIKNGHWQHWVHKSQVADKKKTEKNPHTHNTKKLRR